MEQALYAAIRTRAISRPSRFWASTVTKSPGLTLLASTGDSVNVPGQLPGLSSWTSDATVMRTTGGGKVQLTDVDPGAVKIGDRVEMTFRRLLTADGVHNYFWKARLVR